MLNIETFHTIAGGCFGGFQVLEWMRTFPDRIRNAVIISATPRTTTHNLGLWEVLRRAVMSDPNFNGGDYYGKSLPSSGMALAQMFGTMVWMDRAVMTRRFGLKFTDGKKPSYTLDPEFEFQEFLNEVGRRAVGRFDPNSIIYLTKAIDYFDISRGCGDVSTALARAVCRTLLVAYRQDWRYPPEEMREILEAINAVGGSCEMHTCDSSFGHGAFLYDSAEVLNLIGKFMASA
jgi:homoserine O-acetyltransferase